MPSKSFNNHPSPATKTHRQRLSLTGVLRDQLCILKEHTFNFRVINWGGLKGNFPHRLEFLNSVHS